jgi:hypothetical protein
MATARKGALPTTRHIQRESRKSRSRIINMKYTFSWPKLAITPAD